MTIRTANRNPDYGMPIRETRLDTSRDSGTIGTITQTVLDYGAGLSYQAIATRNNVPWTASTATRLSHFFRTLRELGFPVPERPRHHNISPEALDRMRKRMRAVWRAAKQAGVVNGK